MTLANKAGSRGVTLLELSIAMALIGAVGLSIYSMLNIGLILGAKNSAVNTAHEQARVAMLQLVQNLHSAVSLPALADSNGVMLNNPGAGTTAAGISFQLWSGGPYQVIGDADPTATLVQIQTGAADPPPVVGQRLIIESHMIEQDITAVTGLGGGQYNLTLTAPIGVAIQGTGAPTYYNIPCFITNHCFYAVDHGSLKWHGSNQQTTTVLGTDITSPTPFSIPTTPAGALYYRFVAAIDLSTADSQTSNRGFKSANILLNGQVPARARLTTYQ
jgi:prepilin-type N-terminal cleavage/methylation domain-containing protein